MTLRLFESFLLAVFTLAPAFPQVAGRRAPVDLVQASLEELMEVQVVTVARKSRPLARTAAAVYVITAEDIRRSGARNIPDLLRGVPGIQVGQIDTNTWAVGARGFNGELSNKLLVMVDGRSVYTPMSGGVYWDTLDLLLEDIERIEVIRGPGGSMWGANATNGVINIITRPAQFTTKEQVSAGAGTESPAGWASVRYGAQIGARSWIRATARSRVDRPLEPIFSGSQPLTQAHRTGFRIDSDLGQGAALMVAGDVYGGTTAQVISAADLTPSRIQDDGKRSGGFLQARLTRSAPGGGSSTLQVFFDRQVRSSSIYQPQLSAGDIDYQQSAIRGSHNLTFGGGVRMYGSSFRSLVYGPRLGQQERMGLMSTFLQDEIAIGDNLLLTGGAKFEYNTHSGAEIQPALRVLWTPTPVWSFWGAVSRAVRTPSRGERQMDVVLEQGIHPGLGLPYALKLHGDRNFGFEKLLANEFGARTQLHRTVSLDLASFYNRVSDFAAGQTLQEPGWNPALRRIDIPVVYTNAGYGQSYGAEAAATWAVRRWLKLQGGYAYLHVGMRSEDPARSLFVVGNDRFRKHTGNLRAAVNLPRAMELDAAVFSNGQLPVGISVLDPAEIVAGYNRVDVRYGCKLTPQWEFSVTGQDLLQSRHLEFRSENHTRAMQPGRRFLVEVRWTR